MSRGRRFSWNWKKPSRWGWVTLVSLLLLATSGTLMLMTTCSVFRPIVAQPPVVSVLLAQDERAISLGLAGPYEVLDASHNVVGEGNRLRPGLLQRDMNGDLVLNGVRLSTDEITIQPTKLDPIQLGSHEYAGSLRVMTVDHEIYAHNVLDIETYIAGVLFNEMPASFPIEALKAQAVTARTYAYFRLLEGQQFLRPTDADQVYRGEGEQAERAREIATSTHGQILVWNGEVVPAYYSSTCGGATASSQQVFDSKPLPILQAKACTWCEDSPRYRWRRTLSLGELGRRLKWDQNNYIETIRRRNDSFGRAFELEVIGTSGPQRLTGLRFRSLWNSAAESSADELFSLLWLDLKLHGNQIEIDGAGWGHGVGMCQYGARGLAKEGLNYIKILHYYYDGATLQTRW